jgi:transcriptional regulator with XRE-family HTH domain
VSDLSLGDRIAQIRRRRSLTQEELAARAGVSADLIQKLEQNRRSTSIPTLHAIARALDVETSELLSQGASLESQEEADTANVLVLRQILTPDLRPRVGQDAPEITALRNSAADLTRTYQKLQLQKALGNLTDLLNGGNAAVDSYEGERQAEAHRILSQSYIMATAVLGQFRHDDLGYEAVRRAMLHAQKAGDEILYASAVDQLSLVFMRQARFREAEYTSVDMAESIEPVLSKATPNQVAMWGRLLGRGAASAARNNRPRQADDLLSLARSAAARLGRNEFAYDSYFSSFGPTVVATIEVENAMVQGDAEKALALARSVRFDENMRITVWTRHLLTIAEAQLSTRKYTAAAKTLDGIRDISPEWLTKQGLTRRIVRDLLDSQGVRWARNSGVASLASEMKIPV